MHYTHVQTNGHGARIENQALRNWVRNTRSKFTEQFERREAKFSDDEMTMLNNCMFVFHVEARSETSKAMRTVARHSKQFFAQNNGDMNFKSSSAKLIREGKDYLWQLRSAMETLVKVHENGKLNQSRLNFLKKKQHIDLDEYVVNEMLLLQQQPSTTAVNRSNSIITVPVSPCEVKDDAEEFIFPSENGDEQSGVHTSSSSAPVEPSSPPVSSPSEIATDDFSTDANLSGTGNSLSRTSNDDSNNEKENNLKTDNKTSNDDSNNEKENNVNTNEKENKVKTNNEKRVSTRSTRSQKFVV